MSHQVAAADFPPPVSSSSRSRITSSLPRNRGQSRNGAVTTAIAPATAIDRQRPSIASGRTAYGRSATAKPSAIGPPRTIRAVTGSAELPARIATNTGGKRSHHPGNWSLRRT